MSIVSTRGLSEADLATLATPGSVLPALEVLDLGSGSGSTIPDGVPRLAEGFVAGALPAVTYLGITGMHVGEAGASALAAALDRGAMPRLKKLQLCNAVIGDAGLAALAPALRRRPALKQLYSLGQSVRRRGPRRPRGAAAACCRHAAAAGWRTEEAQGARPRLHPDQRRRVRHPRRRARQRRTACSRGGALLNPAPPRATRRLKLWIRHWHGRQALATCDLFRCPCSPGHP